MPASRPVRVLIVGPSLDIVGGQSIQAVRLIDHLGGEASVEVSFLAINPRLPGVLRRLQAIKYVRTALTSAVYITRLLARIPRQDVVHIFSASHLSFVIAPTPALVTARLFGKPAILNYHSGEADLHLRRWRRTAARTMHLADAIVVPSRFLVGEFGRHGLHARLIPNVIATDLFRFREREPLEPVFLSNRQLAPLYNVACVLRAFALVQQRYATASLIVAADGSERQALESLAHELRLRDVRFIGWVPPDRAPDLYSDAHVYLNGSDSGDNIPSSVLEAFAAGLPVVSTDTGGVGELVRSGETGMLVARGDHAAMAACAVRLLDDPAFSAKLTRNARSECARFEWPAVREHWLTLYHELAGGRLR